MASADHVFGNKQWEINRWILVLSTVGIASKILEIDLSQVSIFGVNLQGKEVSLVPGFIGIALVYAFLAFIVARVELMLAHNDSTIAHVTPKAERLVKHKSKFMPGLIIFSAVIPLFMYIVIPMGLSIFTISLLAEDILVVCKVILNAA